MPPEIIRELQVTVEGNDTYFSWSTGIVKLNPVRPPLQECLRTRLPRGCDDFQVRILLRVMRLEYRRSANQDVDGLHNLDPILATRTTEVETSAVQETAEYLPSAHIEGDVE